MIYRHIYLTPEDQKRWDDASSDKPVDPAKIDNPTIEEKTDD